MAGGKWKYFPDGYSPSASDKEKWGWKGGNKYSTKTASDIAKRTTPAKQRAAERSSSADVESWGEAGTGWD